MNRSVWLRVLMLVATSSAGGALVQVGCAKTIGANINPCGTLLSTQYCDPAAWDLLFVHAQDWERDPTCTIPTLCGPWPASGTGTTTGTTTTGTTAGTTTTGTTGTAASSLIGSGVFGGY